MESLKRYWVFLVIAAAFLWADRYEFNKSTEGAYTRFDKWAQCYELVTSAETIELACDY